jgi:formylglycine-generating enzyme required for sulfatase activity
MLEASVHDAAPGTNVTATLRRMDDATLAPGEVIARRTMPLQGMHLEPGSYRLIVDGGDAGFAEIDAHLAAPGDRARLEVSLRPTEDVTTDMVKVPGGTLTFRWTDDRESMVTATLTVAAFWIDRCEVSNAEYREFVDATGHRAPLHWIDGYDAAWDDLPIVDVARADADAYAGWRGKRLPTLPEWELAARGAEGRLWPWGNGAPPSTLPWDEGAARALRMARDGPSSRAQYLEHVLPVGSHPELATPDGIFHMFGNVKELTGSAVRFGDVLLKGAAWHEHPDEWDLTRCQTYLKDGRAIDVGFRCARSAAP